MSTLPCIDFLSEITFKHKTDSSISRSVGGARQSFGYGGGYWELNLNYAEMDIDNSKKLMSFVNGLEGSHLTFDFYLPEVFQNKLSFFSDITIKGANQIGKEIIVDGLAVSKTILTAGHFIQFSNSNKVYQLSKDLISDSSGEGILYLHMPIVGNNLPADNSAVNYRQPKFTLALAENTIDWSLDHFLNSTIELPCEEVWN